MTNYKIIVQYRGSNFAGWQMQDNAFTVQQALTDGINKITREKVNLIGSGRTDAGVHALGQTANFRIEKEIIKEKFLYSLNSVISKDISVISIEDVEDSFHARFDAKKRSYIYLFTKIKSPFYNEFSYHVNWIDDKFIADANKLSKTILGIHDFTSFCRINIDLKSKQCEIFDIHWKNKGELVCFYIEANRYLHGMVRTIVGTVIQGVKQNCEQDYLLKIIDSKNRESAGMAAPARGLFLYKVKY